MSIRKASQAHNVLKATLGTKLKLNTGADTAVAAKLGRKSVLGECFAVLIRHNKTNRKHLKYQLETWSVGIVY